MYARICVLALLGLAAAAPSAAQGLGIGGRFAMVRGDVDVDDSAVRFTGGQLRARMSPRTALEVSLDRRTVENDAATERVRDTPIQASLLLYPLRGAFAPYLLGGPGWYSHKVETLAGGDVLASESSREFGWHAGFGAELALGRHLGLHADYRYTFLDFGDDDAAPAGARPAAGAGDRDGISGLLPSYRGSMWTAGITVYF